MSGGILTDPTSDNIEFLKKKNKKKTNKTRQKKKKKKKKKKNLFFSLKKKKKVFFPLHHRTVQHVDITTKQVSIILIFSQETVHPHFRQNRLAVMKKERRVLH